MNGTKRCATCNNVLPVANFYPDKSRADGIARLCKSCNRERNKTKYAANAERDKERARQWRLANLERSKETDRRKWQRNRAKKMAQQRAWVAAHPERFAAIRKASAKRNRKRVLATNRRVESARRAARAGVGSIPFTPAQLDARLAFYGYRCWMCGGPYEHLDHVKPLSKGGPHMLANLRPSCRRCNMSKSGAWPYSVVREVA